MKPNVAVLLRRLEKLEERAPNRRGYMIVPEFVSPEEWSEAAAQEQAILKANVREPGPPDYTGIPQQRPVRIY